MEKDLIINKLIHNGYTVDLTLQDDCLYCANTDTLYILNSFTVDQEITFSDHNNKKRIIKAVKSDEFNFKGYYII